MTAAGRYAHRVRIDRRSVSGGDGYGNVLAAWAPLVTRWAAFRAQSGREQVEAGRLESTMVGTLTFRRDAMLAGVSAADRVVFISGPYAGRSAQIRSIVPTGDGADIDMTIEVGVAA
jgi:head-tail adaptor